MAVLLIACSAVVTGATSFAAIGEWAADAPQDVLACSVPVPRPRFVCPFCPAERRSGGSSSRPTPAGWLISWGMNPAGNDTLAVDGKSEVPLQCGSC
nr:hypothetical protein [Streptomyces sp. TRM72054]